MVRFIVLAAVFGGFGTSALAQVAPPTSAASVPAGAPITDPTLLSARPRFLSGPDVADDPVVKAAVKTSGGGAVVRLTITVLRDGTARDAKITAGSGDAAVDAAILRATAAWKFAPARDKTGALVDAVTKAAVPLGSNPQKIAGTTPAFPEEAKQLGHNGKVVAKGRIDETGKLVDVSIAESSKSPLLDGAVLTALADWRFAVPKDLAGTPKATDVSLPFDFSQAEGSAQSYIGNLRFYRCDVFVRETDWWVSAHPDQPISRHQFYTFMAGVQLLVPEALGLPKANLGSPAGIKELSTRHATAWSNAVTRCRASPQSTFLAEYRKQ